MEVPLLSLSLAPQKEHAAEWMEMSGGGEGALPGAPLLRSQQLHQPAHTLSPPHTNSTEHPTQPAQGTEGGCGSCGLLVCMPCVHAMV
jgi:hypothetical protein